MQDSGSYWDSVYGSGSIPEAEGWFLPLLPPPPASVLDVGCGAGSAAAMLCEAGYAVTGIDGSAVGVALARGRAPAAKLLVWDFRDASIPCGPGPYDALLSDLSLHYFRTDETVGILRRIITLLDPKGVMLLRVNSSLDTEFGAGVGEEIEPGLFLDRKMGTVKRFFTEGDLRDVLAAGVAVETVVPRTTRRYGGKEKRVLECVCRPATDDSGTGA